MQKPKSALLLIAGSLLTLFSVAASADWGMNLRPGVTPVTQEVFELHTYVLYWVYAIGAVVTGVILWSVVFHRKSRGAESATWHEHLGVEIVWTIVPFIILGLLAVPATKTLLKMEDTTTDVDVTIKATGYQWMWSYEYMGSKDFDDEGINFYSKISTEDNEVRQLGSGMDPVELNLENYLYDVDKVVYVPVGKKVRVLMTAVDVIHSWWVPDLAGKKDAIPGFINELWFKAEETGTFRGSCAELCGKDPACLPIVVKVVTAEEYKAWVAEQKGTSSAAAVSDNNAVALAQ
jgi:cytochrome c oxidase subunit 2